MSSALIGSQMNARHRWTRSLWVATWVMTLFFGGLLWKNQDLLHGFFLILFVGMGAYLIFTTKLFFASQTEQHNEFVQRMVERGYTERQVRRLVDWYMRVNKAG